VAERLAGLVASTPSPATLEIAGPDTFHLNELVQWVMYSYQDDWPVVADAGASYYGGILDDHTLTPGPDAVITATHFKDWLDGYLSGSIEIPHVHHPDPIAHRRA